MPAFISAAVEGLVDEAVVRKLIAQAGGEIGSVYGKNGKPELRQKINGYANAARYAPWIVLVDLDTDADCAPSILGQWLPNFAPTQNLCFRVAVREVEAWLIADADTFSQFLRVRLADIPSQPEELEYPKDKVVELARRSRNQAIQRDMVPRLRSGRRVGPAYTSRLIEYINEHWRPAIAAQRSDSLRRALDCVEKLAVSTP